MPKRLPTKKKSPAKRDGAAQSEPIRKGRATLAHRGELVLEAARVGTWSWNTVTNIVNWDSRCKALFGAPQAATSVSYREFISYIHLDDLQQTEEALQQFLKTRGEYDAVHRVIWPDKSVHWLRCNGRFVSGKLPTEVMGISIDVTWVKHIHEEGLHTEDQLRKINQQLDQQVRERTAELERRVAQVAEQAALLDLANDGIFVRAADMRISYWNKGAERLYGWTKDEAVGYSTDELVKTEFPVPFEQIVNSDRWEGELRQTKRDGSKIAVASRWTTLRDQHGKAVGWLEINTDISGRKAAEEAALRLAAELSKTNESLRAEIAERIRIEEELRKSEERFSKAFRASPDAGMITCVDNREVIDVNERWRELFGYSPEEAVGRAVTDLQVCEPGCYEEIETSVTSGSGVRDKELEVRDKAGNRKTALLAAEQVTLGKEPCFIITFRDITERKRLEQALQDSQAELARISRAVVLGQLAASIAHEVNQPIAAVVANSNACLRWLAATPPNLREARTSAEKIIRDGNRATEVIKRIRASLQKTPSARTKVDLNRLISETLVLMNDAVSGRGVTVVLKLAKDLPKIEADPILLQQVILNLVSNAVDAMREVNDRPKTLRIASARVGSEQIAIKVEDSGSGIDAATLKNIFEPFFTTKPTGMGLGLSISRSIIEGHGGRLTASSNNDYGTTFQFSLPLSAEVAS